MKQFLTLALTCFPFLCFSAPTYTTYFNNTHTYTNSTVAGADRVGSLVATNGVTSQDLTASRAAFTDSNKKIVSTGTSAALLGALSDPTGTGVAVFNTSPTFSTQITLNGSGAVILTTDAANTLAQYSGTSAQAYNIYNTRTDASNYERGVLKWESNALVLGTEKLGTGTARVLTFRTDGQNRWRVDASGHFIAVADNTYDIGASGATRPRDVFVADDVVVGGDVTAGALLQNSGIRVMTPSSIQTLAAANALLANATKVRVVGSGGAVTLTSTPTIADGSDGQYVMIQGTDNTNTLTVQDQGSLASSNLELGAATRVLGAGDVLVLTFDSTASVWYEVSFANN